MRSKTKSGAQSELKAAGLKDFEQVPKILETPYIKAEDSKKSYPPYKYEIEMLKQEQFDPQMKEKILEDNQK